MNHYKGSKIRITLLIEYLKVKILFEIRITPQAKSIMFSLNDSCWLNISMRENLFEIRITPQACQAWMIQPKLYRIAKELSHWLRKAPMLLLLYLTSLLQIQYIYDFI